MHTTLTDGDLQFVVRRIPRDIRDLLMSGNFFLGGGFIRETISGGAVQDIDLFGATAGQLLDAADALALKRGVKVHTTKNAITVACAPRLPVQFITRWTFTEVEPLIASFDFTVCQAAIYFDRVMLRWRSAIGAGFYPDLAARRLTYTAPTRDEEPGGSMLRVRKFLMRGYNIQALSLAAVMARCTMKVRNFDGLDEEMRAKVIGGLLHEVDPLTIVDGLDPIDEHEVF